MLTLTSSKAAKAASKSNTRTKTKAVTVEEDNKSQLWTEKYRPKSVADLPVHHSKVRAFKDWLEKALEIHECYFDLGASGQTCFLAVVGNAGCGKSSTVQQVCAEQSVSIIEWSDDLWDPENPGNKADWSDPALSTSSGSGGVYGEYRHRYEAEYGGGYSNAAQNLFKVEGVNWAAHTTKSDTLETFALQSSYPALSLQTKHTTNSSSSINSGGGNKGGNISINGGNSKLARTQSLTNTTTNTPTTYNTSATTNNTTTTSFQRKILLLKDPPTYDAHTSPKHSNLYNFLLTVQCPVVMVLGDVSGRDDYSYAVDRCLPAAVKHRLQFESVFFTPVTEAKVAKILDNILKNERIERDSRQVASIVQDISTSCMGDIRQAVVQLQLLLGNIHHTHNTTNTTTNTAPGKIKRSQSLPNPHYNNKNESSSASIINSESTIYDDIPTNTTSSNKKKQKVEVVDLISPPTSPLHTTTTAHATATTNTADTTYVPPAPSNRRGKRVVYDSDSDDYSIHNSTTTTTANSNHITNNNTSIVRGVSDGVLATNTTSIVYNTTTNNTSTATTTNTQHTVSTMSRRDTSYSSLHSVSKLMNATLDNQGMLKFDPDSVIERSELSAELILAFAQWNWIASVQATPRMYHHHQDADPAYQQEAPPLSEGEVALQELRELEMALDIYSEIDLYTTRKYDTNSSFDRSGSSAYPDGYTQALLSRASCASRGKGAAERKELAKAKGHKGSFQGIYRPRVLDVRSHTGAVQSKLRAIQTELMHLPVHNSAVLQGSGEIGGGGGGGGAGGRYGSSGSGNNSNGYIVHTKYASSHTNSMINSVVDDASTTTSALIVPLRELLLHTIPYHTAISHTIHNTHHTIHNSNHSQYLKHTLPLYTDKVDWMMGNLYNTSQTYTTIGRGGFGNDTVSSVLLTTTQSEGPTDDIISEFD